MSAAKPAEGQPTPAQRLAALTEQALRDAERKAAAGERVSTRELNGLRRLIDRQEADAKLEELRQLTAKTE